MTAFGFGEWGLGLRLVGGDKCVASWRSSLDRKSTRLNSSHGYISYAVFCLKKKKAHGTNGCCARQGMTLRLRCGMMQASSNAALPGLMARVSLDRGSIAILW